MVIIANKLDPLRRICCSAVAIMITLLSGSLLLAAPPIGVGAGAVGNCKFHTAAAQLNFGNLDPAAASDASTTATLSFKCTRGASWSVTDDGGLNDVPAGAYRMRHAVFNAYLPYSLTYTNAFGTSQGANVTEILTVNGLVRRADYSLATTGNYADTVSLTISP